MSEIRAQYPTSCVDCLDVAGYNRWVDAGAGRDYRLQHPPRRRGGLTQIYRYVQGDQLHMAPCFWYHVKGTFTVAYIGQVTFYKVPEKHSHVNLVNLYTNTPCFIEQLVDITVRSSWAALTCYSGKKTNET